MTAALGLFHRLLARMAPKRFGLSLDGRDLSGEYLLLEALNFGAAGPNLCLAPHAEPSDGLLDVVVVDEDHRRDLTAHFLCSESDRQRTAALPVYQARHVALFCEGCDFHLDDDVRTGQHAGEGAIVIDLSVEPNALTFLSGAG